MKLIFLLASVMVIGCKSVPEKAVGTVSWPTVSESDRDISSVERAYVATHHCTLLFHAAPETKLERNGTIVYSDEMKKYKGKYALYARASPPARTVHGSAR